MKELILTLHGLGEPHSLVSAEERRFWWREASFECLLDQILDRPAEADPQVAITFDDGNSSDVLVALPQLARRRLTASFFICAGRVGKRHYLDQAMIKELIDAGMSVGSHGMDHRDWRSLNSEQLDVEVATARRNLEDLTQRRITKVAIPFGSYDRRVLRHLKQEPWECIYTSDRGISRSQSRMKPRETLDTNMADQDVVRRLTLPAPAWVRTSRALSRACKRFR
jgi:peptidoglycan/xylan/chitin deacetylase (PgdA/CDA1 family)